MKMADRVVSWLIVVMGVVHISLTPHRYAADALWFFNGGLTIILIGALNLLRARYSYAAPGMRLFCVIADLVFAAFAFIVGRATGTVVGPPGIVMVLCVAAAILSVRPGSDARIVKS